MQGNRVATGFDRLARVYDRIARLVYGKALRNAQTCFLSALPKHAEVLVVGGGSGWFLEQLLVTCNPSFVLYVELSPKMLALARTHIAQNCPQHLQTVEFVQGSVEGIVEEGAYDVVVTHCLLDMFEGLQLQAIVARLKRSLGSRGWWYFSDFRKARQWPMSWISRGLIWGMYRFFRWVCGIPARRLADFEGIFADAGMLAGEKRLFFGGMIEGRIWRRGK